jgi:hypothetical protein
MLDNLTLHKEKTSFQLALWFEIVIIFQDETINLEGIYTILKIHVYSTMINKKQIVIYWGNYKQFFITSCKLYHLKIYLYEKINLKQNNM